MSVNNLFNIHLNITIQTNDISKTLNAHKMLLTAMKSFSVSLSRLIVIPVACVLVMNRPVQGVEYGTTLLSVDCVDYTRLRFSILLHKAESFYVEYNFFTYRILIPLKELIEK